MNVAQVNVHKGRSVITLPVLSGHLDAGLDWQKYLALSLSLRCKRGKLGSSSHQNNAEFETFIYRKVTETEPSLVHTYFLISISL